MATLDLGGCSIFLGQKFLTRILDTGVRPPVRWFLVQVKNRSPAKTKGGKNLSKDVRLSIRDIRNANPVWLRKKGTLGPLDALKESLQQYGIEQPVLLRDDFVLLDGARRVEAADNLGWTEVPVVVAHDWDTVLDYFAQLNALDRDKFPAKPLRWAEWNELWSQLLKPLHEGRRVEQSVSERVRRARLRAQGASEAEIFRNRSTYTNYTNDVADMYQIRPIHVKLIRDIFHTFEMQCKRRPEIVKPFEKLVAQAESIGIKTTSTVRGFTRSIAQGMPLDVALKRAESGLANAHEAPWRLNKRQAQVKRTKAPVQPVETPAVGISVIRNLTTLLEQVSQEANRIHRFGNDVRPHMIDTVAYDIKTAVSRIQAMRRRMETHGQSLGESE